MIKTADRYVGGVAVAAIIMVWVALTTLMSMFTLLDELGSTSENYGLLDVLWYVLLTGPRSAYIVFPVSALLGALIGVGGLAASNELVALRTAGASRLRISGSVLGGTLLLTIGVVIMGEWFSPVVEREARNFKQSREQEMVIIGGPRGLWIRDGADFVNIKRPVLTSEDGEDLVTYQDIVLYRFDQARSLSRITRADQAVHDGSSWQLSGVRHLDFGDTSIAAENLDHMTWGADTKPELLNSAITRPRYMSIRELTGQLEFMAHNGLDGRVYQSALWAKLMYPFTVLALVLSGMPFVFGSARHQSMGMRIFIGMSLGGLFMIVSRAAQNYGDAYSAPLFVSTVAPALVLAVVVVLILRRSV